VAQLEIELPPAIQEEWGFKVLDLAAEFLSSAGARLLAALLEGGYYCFVESEDGALPWEVTRTIRISSAFVETLSDLPDSDKERILRAIAATDPAVPDHLESHELRVAGAGSKELSPAQELLALLVKQRELMKSVAMGSPPIRDVNDLYKVRRQRISERLRDFGLEDANPHVDLWEWYRYWKEELTSWADRRRYVDALYEEQLMALVGTVNNGLQVDRSSG
jgi:hypothetical protein